LKGPRENLAGDAIVFRNEHLHCCLDIGVLSKPAATEPQGAIP
jgi:hypothetical protein